MGEKIKYINASDFQKEVLQGGNVIVDFYSTECPPCEALASKYESLSKIYGDDIVFLKIFRQENRELAENLHVTSSPTLIFYKDGKEVGERYSGGIKRQDILKNIELLIGEKKFNELSKNFNKTEVRYDVAIIGGGPAGLTAGIYAAQAKLKTVIIDKAMPGGQVTTTHLVSNYPGFEKPIEGFMLMHFISEQAKLAGVEFRSAVDINRIDLKQKSILIDELETIHAKKIIIASGASYRELQIPGEQALKGKGISYCATCDAKYFEDKEVVVIGGGNSAIEESLFITKFAKKVTIVHQFDHLQANKVAQEQAFNNKKIQFIFEHEPREFKRLDNGKMEITIEDLKVKSLKTITSDGVFIFIGMRPNTELIQENLTTNEWGYIEVNEFMQTNIADIYAIGDIISKPYRQITTAVSDGTIAAIKISQELE